MPLHYTTLLDWLKGPAKRMQIDVLLELGLQLSHKFGETLSLIIIDIGFFKRYNETYGHVAGDMWRGT